MTKRVTKAAKPSGTPLVVTTQHKGVFFGYGSKTAGKTIVLKQARMCVSWSSTIRGVLGLAAVGPDANCRISFAAPELTLQDVTAVLTCSKEAAIAWEKGPWA